MLLQATRTIGDGIRALHELGRRAIARLQRVPLGAVLTFTVALAWLLAAGWWNYMRPQDFDAKAYARYQEQVAQCRELKTSEGRYDCVVQSMIHRDQANFGTAMFVFLPPILLIFGHYLWREIRASMREREHARRAEERSRRQLSKLRQEMTEERAAAQAAQALVKSAEEEHGLAHGHRAHGMPHPSTPRPPPHPAAAPAPADSPARARLSRS
jgi:signal transduction histidine kinase